ncbi:MAG: ribbon-helix-helix protein, CopG family [Nakamurella sp.]
MLPDVDLAAKDVRDSKGRRITEEYAGRATEHALASVRRGRPSLTRAKSPSPQSPSGVTPQLRQRADAEAAKQGRRVSDLAREALERYLGS